MYCITVDEMQASAMMYGVGHVSCMEGTLVIAVHGGWRGLYGLHCAAEGMAGADEVRLVPAQCRGQG